MTKIPPGFGLGLQKQLLNVSDIASCRAVKSDYWASALDQADQNCDHRQDEQEMNKSTQCVRTDHAQQPENQQQNGYSPEHRHSLVDVCVSITNSTKVYADDSA
jgi:hypothetical protein